MVSRRWKYHQQEYLNADGLRHSATSVTHLSIAQPSGTHMKHCEVVCE